MGKKSGGRVRVKQVGPKGAPVNPLDALSIPPEEMIHLPPKPDSNIAHVWPLNETFTMEYKSFAQIYPTYLDSTKTVKRGRRISAADAVPTPTVMDITHALQSMGIRHVVQPYKGYSRDVESQWDNPGRVFVDLEKPTTGMGADGSFDVDNLPEVDEAQSWNKKALMREIAQRIPNLPSRIQRLEQAAEEAERKAKEEAAAAHKVASQKASTGVSKKKKGKKKR